jgi:two-component system LytT family response regulator
MHYEGACAMRTRSEGHSPDGLPEAKDSRYPAEPSMPVVGDTYPLTRIAVKSVNRIAIVQVASIIRLEAEDNYVRLWAERPYLHKETLTGLLARLDPIEFLRIHRSHAVNVRFVRELRPLLHGEYQVILSDGTELTSGRSYRAVIQAMFGLG